MGARKSGRCSWRSLVDANNYLCTVFPDFPDTSNVRTYEELFELTSYKFLMLTCSLTGVHNHMSVSCKEGLNNSLHIDSPLLD